MTSVSQIVRRKSAPTATSTTTCCNADANCFPKLNSPAYGGSSSASPPSTFTTSHSTANSAICASSQFDVSECMMVSESLIFNAFNHLLFRLSDPRLATLHQMAAVLNVKPIATP